MSQPHQAREIGLGAVSILIGAALLVGSRNLGAIPGQNYGADTLPRLVALLSIGVGIAMLIQALRPRRGATTGKPTDQPVDQPTDQSADAAGAAGWLRDPLAWLRLGAAAGLILAYALFSPITGFVVAGIAVVAGFALLLGVRPVYAAILGITAALVLRYVFADILLVPLPRMDLPWMGD